MHRPLIVRLLAAVFAFCLIASACGDDDDTTTTTATTTDIDTDTTTEAVTPEPGAGSEPAGVTGSASAPPDENETYNRADSAGESEVEGPADEAATAWSVVFDSTTPFDAKAAHLEDADALADTIAAYETTGSTMGGIRLDPTDVSVDGETATITYDVYFGENPAYTAVEGTAVLVDGSWVVSRDTFCEFMASARNSCP